MVTGDNPLTAETIAHDVGVDEFLADATPEDKLALIVSEQAKGNLVAMTGDGTNDAPALAQADVGVAMFTSTPVARARANMIILDDDPTKLVEIIATGRRQMATRGALLTFNIANDVIRFIAYFPAFFVGIFPQVGRLNILHLHSPASAIMSTVVYFIVVIGVLIPLGLMGVPYRMANLARALNRNLLYYGLGGLVVAAVGIKGLDMLIGLIPGY
jgi:K+-transporting ATPase ATPase B chain